jgi:hypothetical protein
VNLSSNVLHAPLRVTQKPDVADQSRKLTRSPKKVLRGQITVKKIIRPKSAPVSREAATAEKKENRSVSPDHNKVEAAPPVVGM